MLTVAAFDWNVSRASSVCLIACELLFYYYYYRWIDDGPSVNNIAHRDTIRISVFPHFVSASTKCFRWADKSRILYTAKCVHLHERQWESVSMCACVCANVSSRWSERVCITKFPVHFHMNYTDPIKIRARSVPFAVLRAAAWNNISTIFNSSIELCIFMIYTSSQARSTSTQPHHQ